MNREKAYLHLKNALEKELRMRRLVSHGRRTWTPKIEEMRFALECLEYLHNLAIQAQPPQAELLRE